MSPERHDLSEALSREADAASARPVDLDAVLRESRSRRRSRRRAVVGATASIAGLLAVGGLVLGLGATGSRTVSSTADGPVAEEAATAESAEGGSDEGAGDASESGQVAPQDGAQFDEDLRIMAAETLNTCGAPITPAADATDQSLAAVVEPPARPVPAGSASTVAVRVTNTGARPVEGTLGTPAITVSDEGTTVWHPLLGSAAEPVAVRLAPGESVALDARFTAGSCAAGGEQALGTPALEPLAPGAYGLSAAIAFTPSDGALGSLIVSPAAPVRVG